MYIVKEIRITGISKLKVNIEVADIEAFRRECARTYKVKSGEVKFVYEERE
jgi:hypothetical protein